MVKGQQIGSEIVIPFCLWSGVTFYISHLSCTISCHISLYTFHLPHFLCHISHLIFHRYFLHVTYNILYFTYLFFYISFHKSHSQMFVVDKYIPLNCRSPNNYHSWFPTNVLQIRWIKGSLWAGLQIFFLSGVVFFKL